MIDKLLQLNIDKTTSVQIEVQTQIQRKVIKKEGDLFSKFTPP